MGDGVADIGGRNELADFVENRGNGFGLKFGIHSVKLVDPEVFEGLVLELTNNFVTEVAVSQDFHNMDKVRIRGVD